MRNVNRLIDDFKFQTKTTIWKHLEAMAANYAVYSTHLNGLAPFLTNYDVYLYCNDTNVVIVCLDCCGYGDDQVYEESEELSPMIYEEDNEPRVSVVWKMSEAVRQVKSRLQLVYPDVNVFGLLLTEAEILNSYALYSMWFSHDFSVIDEFTRLKYRSIRVSNVENDDLECKKYVKIILDTSLEEKMEEKRPIIGSAPTSDSSDYGEFEKMLNDFINSEFKKEMVDEESKEDTEDEEDDESEEEETSIDAEVFPTGEVEQNSNISVKVDILRPIPNPREELDKLVGCADIKRRMDELVALTSYNKMMRELFPGMKQHEVSLHSVFLGRPGTGKTTVCKIFVLCGDKRTKNC